jgi:BASS family bile acid:Na+ symporter
MTIAELIPLAIALSISLIVLALGLDSSLRDAVWLFRKPGLLARSIVSLNVLMVLLALAAAKLLKLDPAIETAIIALAISPVPPIFPKKQSKVGATDSYAIALLVAASLFSVVLIPAWLGSLGDIFGFEAKLALPKVLTIVFIKILLPLSIGILIRHLAPHFAHRAAKPISLIATVLLVGGILPVLFTTYHAMWVMVGNGVLATVFLFAVVGLIVGHLLGGPDPDDRSVLALATSTRHPGIAIAIATLNFPERKAAILIVVLFHLIVGAIVAIPYMKWRNKMHSSLEAQREV